MEKHKNEGGLSLRNIKDINLSLLTKQAWRIHQNNSSLIHRLYKAKYHNDPLSKAMEGKKTASSSYAYRSMWKASMALREGFYKQLGNGKSIDIEKDDWAGVKIKKKKKQMLGVRELE